MKKPLIVSIIITLLFFIAFFSMLILSDTPTNLSLIGSAAATIIAGTYCAIIFFGKPFKWLTSHIDNLTTFQRAGFFAGMVIMNLSVCHSLLETGDSTMDNLPLATYGICLAISIVVGIFTRLLFKSVKE